MEKVAKKSTTYHERLRTARSAVLPQGCHTKKFVEDWLRGYFATVGSAGHRKNASPKIRTGPVSRARLLIPYPAGSQLRSSGRLGGPLLRAVTGTLHVLLSSPGISQSPTPTARQQNCSGSRDRAFVMGTAARFEVHDS